MAQKKAFDLQEGERIMMNLKDQVILGMRCCIDTGLFTSRCSECPYDKDENGTQRGADECKHMLIDDFEFLMSDIENTINLLEGKL